jgi:hypothetical protein
MRYQKLSPYLIDKGSDNQSVLLLGKEELAVEVDLKIIRKTQILKLCLKYTYAEIFMLKQVVNVL